MNVKKLFTESQQQEIMQAIASAELNTSGEIRLHLLDRCKTDPEKEAIAIFQKLGMHKTEARNGVLIFLALSDKKFAIIGDQGINDKVPADFWNSVRDEMLVHFKAGDLVAGICRGIILAGEKLKLYFPYQQGDQNELSNEISYDEN